MFSLPHTPSRGEKHVLVVNYNTCSVKYVKAYIHHESNVTLAEWKGGFAYSTSKCMARPVYADESMYNGRWTTNVIYKNQLGIWECAKTGWNVDEAPECIYQIIIELRRPAIFD